MPNDFESKLKHKLSLQNSHDHDVTISMPQMTSKGRKEADEKNQIKNGGRISKKDHQQEGPEEHRQTLFEKSPSSTVKDL